MTMEHHNGPPTHSHSPHEGPAYERRDANIRGLLIGGLLLIFFIVAVEAVMMGGYELLVKHGEPKEATNPAVSIYAQLQLTRKAEDEALSSYGWVDRKAGIVRIPIDQAIDLVAKQGVPKGKGPKSEAEVNSHHGTPVKPEAPGGAADKAQAKDKDETPAKAGAGDTKK